ncbi:Immunoglobulin V-set domain [Nesidiocoris tenuis]|uniref:Immunoglobulin V-set domain n=1 Tax=Nesidiocoris tenuis TaxID=355587 RepID=A0ABN7AJ83_9HEMI|nr:Immunoglobulin V-set domain [Nesidiocoris tenuis]
MLSIPHQLVSAPIGYNVTLECFTEAHPTSLNYWTRGDGQMIYEGKKYHIQSRSLELPYKTQMKLTIYRLRPQDLGTYKCVAKNPRGETDGSIRLYDTQIEVGQSDNKTSDIPHSKFEKGNKLQTSFNTIEKLSNKEREHLGKVDQFGGSNANIGSPLAVGSFYFVLSTACLRYILDYGDTRLVD